MKYSFFAVCASSSQGVSLFIDLSWSPWEMVEDLALKAGVPIVRSLLGPQQIIRGIDEYLESRNATDAAIILETESGWYSS